MNSLQMVTSNKKSDMGFLFAYLDLTLSLSQGQVLGCVRLNETGRCIPDLLKIFHKFMKTSLKSIIQLY